MMSFHVRTSVASFLQRYSSSLCNSNSNSIVCFSLSHVYFSSSTETQSATSPVVNLLKYNFSPEVVSLAASLLSRCKNPSRSDSVLSFLKENGFTDAQMEKVVKYRPSLLSANVEKILEPKIKLFQESGFHAPQIAELISRHPTILQSSLSRRIIPNLSVLKELLGSNKRVIKILMRCSWFLETDLKRSMVPNLEFLKSCGIPTDYIIGTLCNFPRFFLLEPEIVRKSVEQVDEVGLDRSLRNFVDAVRVVSLCCKKSWELKLKMLRKFGFSEEEFLDMFRRYPGMLSIGAERIENVIELLLSTGKYTKLCIYGCPVSLTYSIENRFKPRLHALKVLEKKNLIKKWPSLGTVCVMTDAQFFGRYIDPYLNEIGDIHMEHVDLVANES